jgi:predicted DNA-binding transcriptional regulator YafY
MSKSTTLRHLTMLMKIPIYPVTSITTKDIHQHVIEEGYNVSKRTIERDLEKLADLVGLTFEETPDGYAWCRLGNNNGKFKEILPIEALMLVLSEKLLLQTMPQSYKAKIVSRVTKAKNILNSGHSLGAWQDKLQVISDGYPLINDHELIESNIRETVYDSVLKESVLTISYYAKAQDNAMIYQLNPLGIIIRGQSHYLVATKVSAPEEPKLFLFHRITDAKYEYQDICKPSTFTLKEYFANNPSGWMLRDTNEMVELKVRGFALDVLKHNRLSEDQTLKMVDKEWATVQFTCIPTYDLTAWILRYGSDVICISPEHLKNRVVSTLQKTMAEYVIN